MYKEFYKLRITPFALTPDPEFLFLTMEHREAVASLMYAVLARRGMSVLIGDAGTGKSTLLRSLMRSIPDSRATFSVLVNPKLTAAEFLRSCVAGFGVHVDSATKDVVLTRFNEFLLRIHKENRVAALIVDEAQFLTGELLEDVRLLTNLETDRDKLLQVILAGQDEFADILDRYELRQFKQRVSTRVHIRCLAADSVPEYIQYRWSRCSADAPPFDPGALSAIARITGGIPRVINAICENALILGFAEGKRTINANMIESVAADLHLIPPAGVYNVGRREVKPRPIADEQLDFAETVSKNGTQRHAPTGRAPYAQRSRWRMLFGLE